MFNKISTTFVLFLILGLVSPIFASSPCNCETLPSHVGTIIGDLEHLVDEVVSNVIEPVGSAVTSLVDDLLSNLLDVSNILGSDSNLVDLDGVFGNSGIVGGLLGCGCITPVMVLLTTLFLLMMIYLMIILMVKLTFPSVSVWNCSKTICFTTSTLEATIIFRLLLNHSQIRMK